MRGHVACATSAPPIASDCVVDFCGMCITVAM